MKEAADVNHAQRLEYRPAAPEKRPLWLEFHEFELSSVFPGGVTPR